MQDVTKDTVTLLTISRKGVDMPILAIFTGKGISKQQYEELRKEVHWENQLPKGAIIHIASFDEAGDAHVADVWTSPEELNEFVTTRLMPAMQKLKIQPPKVDIYPTHNINAYIAVSQFILK
jgi:hypothetical protein